MIGKTIIDSVIDQFSLNAYSSDIDTSHIFNQQAEANKLIDANQNLTDSFKQQTKEIINNKTASELANLALKQATTNTNTYTSSLLKSTKAGKLFISAIKGISSTAISSALGVVGGIILSEVISKIYEFISSIKTAEERLEDARDSFESTKSEIKSVNSELEETRKQISDLQSKDKLTFSDQSELERLRAITKELQLQNEALEKQQEENITDLVESNSDVFNKEYGTIDNAKNLVSDNLLGMENLETAKEIVPALIKLEEDYTEQLNNGNTDLANATSKMINILKDNLSESDYTSILAKLSDFKQDLFDVMDYRDLTEEEQNLLSSIEEWQKSIYEYTDPSAWNQIQFDDIFNTSGLQDKKEELIELIKAGKIDRDSIKDLEYYDELLEAIANADFIPQDGVDGIDLVLNQLYALSDALEETEDTASNVKFNIADEETSEKIDNYQSKLQSLASAMEKLSNQELTNSDLIDLQQDFPELVGETDNLNDALQDLINNTLSDLTDELEDAGVPQSVIDSFRELANVAMGLGETNWTGTFDVFDTAESTMSSLAEMVVALGDSYTLTAEEARKFADVFPELLAQGQVTASGLIQFNQSVIDDFVAGKEAEVQADVDAQILQLENRKAILEAKKATAQAALDLVTAQASAEIDGENQKNKKIAEAADNLTQHLMDLGVDEANADATTKELMAGNMEEYDRVVSEVSGNVDLNLTNSINDAAGNVNVQSKSMINSLYGVAQQAVNTAKSILSIGKEEGPFEAVKSTIDGVKDAIADFDPAEITKNFKKKLADYVDVDEYKEVDTSVELQLDIDNYDKEIAEIDSQIALLEANKNTSFDDYLKDARSKSGSKDKTNEEQKEFFNWMERKLDVIAAKHQDLQDVIDDETKSYQAIDNALENVILLDNDKLSILEQQLETYKKLWIQAFDEISEESLKQFGPEGITKEELQKRIIEGGDGVDIFTLPEGSSDEAKEAYDTLIDQIGNAEDAYKQVEQTEESVDETEQDIRDHQKERFDNRIAEIEAENDALKSRQSIIESEMDLFNQRGDIVNEGMYRELIDLSERQAEVYQREIEEAQDRMAAVDEGSAEYFELKSQINDCEQAILECTIQQEEWNEAIKRIPIDRIEKYIAMLEDIKEDLTNFMDEQSGFGIDATEDQYQQLIDISEKEISKLLEQQKKLSELLNDYRYGSDKYEETASEIQDIDNEISSLIQSQNEWNEAILNIPIQKMQDYVDSLDNAKNVLDGYINAQNAKGVDTTVEQYQSLYAITTKQIQALKTQREMYSKLLGEYEVGSSKYIEIQNQISSIDNELNSLIQSQYEYNAAILQIPINNLNDVNDELNRYSDVLSDVLSDYDAALNAVNSVLDNQIEKIEDLKEATEEEYEAKIKPLQDELDLLQDTNEERQIQLALEQAQYDLERAKNQKTNKVIREGEIVYEANQDDVRQAEQDLADAQYDKIVYDLEKQIEILEKERDEILEGYDDEIERLTDIQEKWANIVEEIQLASDILKGNEIFGEGWVDKVISGNDEDIYNNIKDLYEATQTQKDQVDKQIESNERIIEMMQLFVEQYQSGAITYEQAIAHIQQLSITMKDGYSALEQLNGLLALDNISDLTMIYSSAQEKISDSINSLNKYMEIVKGNLDSMNQYTNSWDEINSSINSQVQALDKITVSLTTFEEYLNIFKDNANAISDYTKTWDEMKENIASQIEALEQAAKALEEMSKNSSKVYYASSGGGKTNNSKNEPQGWDNVYVASGPGHSEEALLEAIERGDKIIYHQGIKKGAVGDDIDKDEVEALQALSLRRLRDDELPIIAQKGEVLLNKDQQSMLLDNFYRAMSNPIGINYDNLPTKNIEQRVEINFPGDIVVQNVNNPDEFAENLFRQFVPAMGQGFSKVFKN